MANLPRGLHMRTFIFIALALATASSLSAAGHNLPPEVHPSFVDTLDQAVAAKNSGENRKAMAMLEGILYPNGITVGLDYNSAGSYLNSAKNAVNRAKATWDYQLDGDSPIKLTSSQNAEITIVFTSKIPEASVDALGLIDLKKEYRWNRTRHEVTNSGTIYVLKSWDGESLSEDQITEIVTHEFGHMLGLGDVSHIGHLMGPMVKSKTTLEAKPHEVRALQMLRSYARSQFKQLSTLDAFSAQIQPKASILSFEKNSYNQQFQCTYTKEQDIGALRCKNHGKSVNL